MSGTEITETLEEQVAPYLAMPYTRMLIPDAEGGGFIAEVLELPGCITQGDSPEEAYRNLEDAMEGYIAVELERGRSVPEPVGMKEFSGRFPLRISSELHRGAAVRALNEGISLNQWIGQAMAARREGQSLADEIVARLTISVAAGVHVQFQSNEPRAITQVGAYRKWLEAGTAQIGGRGHDA